MGVKELPLDSGERVARVFERLGLQRRRKGNYIVLTHPDKAMLSVLIPNHKEVDRRLLQTELRKAWLTVEEFRSAWEKL
jgi:predicted RNA binding protein YcfA (HicA-like mRNA interferase family)